MRARTLREGSVGLLILVSAGLFVGLVLWLQGLTPGGRRYRIITEFENTSGMQVGTTVRYRGVPVGRVQSIEAGANQVEVTLDITQTDLRIPRQVRVETNQSGFIGETLVDIVPLTGLTPEQVAQNPTAADCDSSLILCSGDRIPGEIGISYDVLLRSVAELSDVFTDPELVQDLQGLLTNAALISGNVVTLTDELTSLTQIVNEEIRPMAGALRETATVAGSAARQVELSTRETAAAASSAARQVELSTREVSNLVLSNRSSINTTLDNLASTSGQLRSVVSTLTPVVEDGELIANLEVLSGNAVQASENLRDITNNLNNPANVVLLQQTLESARDVFQSAQKLMADVDELTGDPELRNNIRNLINGLSGLVSSTQELDQRTQIAELLEPIPTASSPPTVQLTPHRPSHRDADTVDSAPVAGSSHASNRSRSQPRSTEATRSGAEDRQVVVINYQGRSYELTVD
jgi:phospholipid/cholesterol/gamma-HCH transport system substrate-binding protein